jgi:hypothetical protein
MIQVAKKRDSGWKRFAELLANIPRNNKFVGNHGVMQCINN